MSVGVPPSAPPTVGAWPMLRAMVGIGLVCGLAIVTAYRGTKPVIERNRAEALQKAVFQALPGAVASATFRFDPATGFAALDGPAGNAELAYAGYDGSGALVGVAIEASGMGYQDTIRVLYGYSPARQAIVGFQVLESRETPGLGDRIGSDPGFLANFEALDVRLADDLAALAHPLQLVKRGEKSQPWQIDAITGATVSSRAVTDLLRASASIWVPRIAPRVDQLRKENER